MGSFSLEIIVQSRQLPPSYNSSLMTIKLVYFKNFFCNKESDKVLREVDLPICKVLFLIFTKIYFFFILFYCVSILPTCMNMFYMCIWCSERPAASTGSPGTRGTGACELPRGADSQALVLWKAAELCPSSPQPRVFSTSEERSCWIAQAIFELIIFLPSLPRARTVDFCNHW